jgi:hypothetical protein
MKQHNRTALLAAPLTISLAAPAAGYDVTDKLAINGLLSGAGQCQSISGVDDADDKCRGGMAIQPEIVFTPTKIDEFYLKLGYGVGNGLNEVSPFALSAWAADLEDDVKDINGRNRDYLLEAWYAHTFELGEANTLTATLGIIDPAFYVNQNAYANDEFTQFMNEVFVNSHNSFLPAYDAGAVLIWKGGALTLAGVGMNVGENDDGNGWNYYAAELGYRLDSALGEGNYRVKYSGTSEDFLDPDGESEGRLQGLSLSFDQELGSVLGAFVRMAWQEDDATVTYKAEYSGGLDIKGTPWGRGEDNIGIGYAYLDGGNEDIDYTHVFETYYRFVVNDYLAVSADVQYMKDEYHVDDSPKGWILGLRATAEL